MFRKHLSDKATDIEKGQLILHWLKFAYLIQKNEILNAFGLLALFQW
jgi:hypothetical protein